MSSRCFIATFLAYLAAAPIAEAVSPPGVLNYQGVLRNASGQPLTGTYGMVFRFFDQASGGVDILSDAHIGPSSIVVTGGLFTAELGGGAINDGSGPGFYVLLAPMFRDYGAVHLQVEVAGEVLLPRVEVRASGYALSTASAENAGNAGNADALDGVDSGSFLRSDVDDAASGRVTFSGGPFSGNVSGGSVYINPASASINQTLLGVAYAGSERLRLDREGELSVASHGDFGGNLAAGNNASIDVGRAVNARITAAGAATAVHAAADQTGITAGDVMGVYAGASKVGGSGAAYGVKALATGVGSFGVYGDGGAYGVYGYADGPGTSAIGVYGKGVRDTGIGTGVWGVGSTTGLYGVGTDASGKGVYGYGENAGGQFDSGSGSNAAVGYLTYKIFGSGSLAFAQNHPSDAGRAIVYNAPEGPEVATYVRGTARLDGGVARVALDETFALVTNPDIGLTAQVTARQPGADLHVETVTTRELVVRGIGSTSFDYLVHGLRIGFEEVAIVQPKERDFPIPSMESHRRTLREHPELSRFTALERFGAMRKACGDTGPLDRSRSEALTKAIGEYVPRTVASPGPNPGEGPLAAAPAAAEAPAGAGRAPETGTAAAVVARPAGSVMDAEGNLYGRSLRTGLAEMARFFPASLPSEAGDVVVIDDAGGVRPAEQASDARVVGIVAGEPGVALGGGVSRITEADPALARELEAARASGDAVRASAVWADLLRAFHGAQAPVALVGVVRCKVDASFGAIRAGDLLVASSTRGHAMKAPASAPQGAVLAKALQGLPSGTGQIDVLVLLR